MGKINRIKDSRAPNLDEGDASVSETPKNGSLGGVGRPGVADEDGGWVALAGTGGDDEPADVAGATDNQHPAPLLLPRRRRHVEGRTYKCTMVRGKI